MMKMRFKKKKKKKKKGGKKRPNTQRGIDCVEKSF